MEKAEAEGLLVVGSPVLGLRMDREGVMPTPPDPRLGRGSLVSGCKAFAGRLKERIGLNVGFWKVSWMAFGGAGERG